MNMTRNLEFLFEVGCLRHIQRTWRQFLGINFESLSDHILRVIWIALVIAQEENQAEKEGGIDTGKLVKMALVHDLAESRSVDVHYVSRQFATRHEHEAIQDTLADTNIADEFLALWEETEKRETLEAQIVKDADNLDVDFELAEQRALGVQLTKDFEPMRRHVGETKLYTATAKKMWQEIQTANPNDWHLKSKNRFSAGDWKK